MAVGRDGECAGIRAAIADSRAGRGRLVAVRGDPGIGKTWLLSYAVKSAEGFRVGRMQGHETERDIPYAGLSMLVGPLLVRCPETLTGSSRAQTTPRGVAALAKTPGMSFGRRLARRRLDPAITPATFLDTALADATELPKVQRAALEGALNLGPAAHGDRVGVMAATMTLLAGAAERQPLLLAVDDVHLIDQQTVDVLVFALRRMYNESLFAILTARTETDVPASTERWLESLEQIHLGGRCTCSAESRCGAATPRRPATSFSTWPNARRRRSPGGRQ